MRYIALALLLACAVAQAQTRVTPCSATTPNNAICVDGVAPTTNIDGTPVVGPLSYRIEQRAGAGPWVTINSTLTTPRAYMTNLAPGPYTFRMYANCATCTAESGPSNEAGGTATQPPRIPNPPVITIAVLIRANAAPVYSILGQTRETFRVGEFYCVVPPGRACGDFLVGFRGARLHRVIPEGGECWGSPGDRPLAAPCAASGT